MGEMLVVAERLNICLGMREPLRERVTMGLVGGGGGFGTENVVGDDDE